MDSLMISPTVLRRTASLSEEGFHDLFEWDQSGLAAADDGYEIKRAHSAAQLQTPIRKRAPSVYTPMRYMSAHEEDEAGLVTPISTNTTPNSNVWGQKLDFMTPMRSQQSPLSLNSTMTTPLATPMPLPERSQSCAPPQYFYDSVTPMPYEIQDHEIAAIREQQRHLIQQQNAIKEPDTPTVKKGNPFYCLPSCLQQEQFESVHAGALAAEQALANFESDGMKPRPRSRAVSDADRPEKPFTCSSCDKAFRRMEHLRRHLKIHTKERPFTCEIVGCGRKFSRSDNLKAHMKTHAKPSGRNIYVEGLELDYVQVTPKRRRVET